VGRAAFAEVAALGGDRRDQGIAVVSLRVEAVARLELRGIALEQDPARKALRSGAR
jgi:hypothetical protein